MPPQLNYPTIATPTTTIQRPLQPNWPTIATAIYHQTYNCITTTTQEKSKILTHNPVIQIVIHNYITTVTHDLIIQIGPTNHHHYDPQTATEPLPLWPTNRNWTTTIAILIGPPESKWERERGMRKRGKGKQRRESESESMSEERDNKTH